jgi:anti-sigma regulatory factor (Ser/Thr protein kinase)
MSYSAAGHFSARTCSSCAAPLTETSKLVVVPGASHRVSRALRAQPQAAGEARRAIAGLSLPAQICERLSLIVSELVTNSVLHAGLTTHDTVALHVDHGNDRVRLAVHDGGPGFTPSPPNDDPDTARGNGLVIAAALSDSWGVDCNANGCTVWCEVATEDGPPVARDRELTIGPAAELALAVATAEGVVRLELPSQLARMNASCPP